MKDIDPIAKAASGELGLSAAIATGLPAYQTMLDQAAEARSAIARFNMAGGHSTTTLAQDAIQAIDRYRALVVETPTDKLLREFREREKMLRDAAEMASKIDFASLHATVMQTEWARASGNYGFDFDTLTRQARWAQNLASHHIELATLQSAIRGVDFQSLNATARAMAEAAKANDLTSFARLADGRNEFQLTALKMSTFAGTIDMYQSAVAIEASYKSLLGGWQTHARLPEAYWRSRQTRRAMYREAEVDPGVIDAPNSLVVEALVESGIVEGRTSESGRVSAVFEIGGVRLTIGSDRAPTAAYRAITVFERSLRRFVAARLIPIAGPEWFSRRAPGPIVIAAKDRRKAAQRDGEERQPLVEFCELGDLKEIMLRTDNWPEFEPFFGRQDYLRSAVDSLIASRRPAYHGRSMDGVRLLEVALTIVKLERDMARGAARTEGWDADI